MFSCKTELYEIEMIICIKMDLALNNLQKLICHHHHHHHHHVVLVARISLILSCHSSLSFIALGRSSGQHPVSSHSCWMYVSAGRPAFARPCVGVHKNTSLMSSSLLLQQCPACLVRLTWKVFVIGGRWPYSLGHGYLSMAVLFSSIEATLIEATLSPLFPIVHHLLQVFKATSRILT